jgi:hypothetical protein
MDFLQNFFHTVYNVPELIRIVGQYGLPLIIFAETGLLLGFFLPGDSLLITAGSVRGAWRSESADPAGHADSGGDHRQRDRLRDRQAHRQGAVQPARTHCSSDASI